jgi:hypothetical protein
MFLAEFFQLSPVDVMAMPSTRRMRMVREKVETEKRRKAQQDAQARQHPRKR